MLNERQAFEAMRLFLTAFWQRGGCDAGSYLVDVLSWTGSEVCDDDAPTDPAQWSDWLDAVAAAQRGERAQPW